MYALKNKVQLIGRLGNNPDILVTEKGIKRARFSMATDEVYRNAEGVKIKETQWHTLIAWGRLADLAEQYLHKGKEIAVQGKLVSRQYTDKDGNKRYSTEIVLHELLMLNGRNKVLEPSNA